MREINHNNSFSQFIVFDRLNDLLENSISENMDILLLYLYYFINSNFPFPFWKINCENKHTLLPPPFVIKVISLYEFKRTYYRREGWDERDLYSHLQLEEALKGLVFLKLQYVDVYRKMVELLSSYISGGQLLHVPFWRAELL